MAKTYKEWEDEAKKSGYYDTFSDEDLNQIKSDVAYGDSMLAGKKEWATAKTPEEKKVIEDKFANERLQRGYYNTVSGDGKGGYRATSTTQANIGGATKPVSKYAAVNMLLEQIAGDKFSYDAKSDKSYALAEEYAKRAMANQMAESALLTGGYGNSYASAAGQQVYTDYMNDAVNDMEDRAYAKWSAERDNKYKLLGLARDMEQEEYDRAIYEDNVKYQKERDKIADERYETEWQTKLDNAAKADAESVRKIYGSQIDSLLAAGGSVEDIPEDVLAGSNYANNIALLKQMETYYKNMNKPSGTSSKPVLSLKEAVEAYNSGNKSSNVIAALEYYYGNDFEEYDVVPPDEDYYTQITNMATDILSGDDGSGNTLEKLINMLNDAKFEKYISTSEIKLIIEKLEKGGIITPVGANYITKKVL